jgi:hypothetical protein
LWADDDHHASKYGAYVTALVLFGTVTGRDPRSLGLKESVAADLGIEPRIVLALQTAAAQSLRPGGRSGRPG